MPGRYVAYPIAMKLLAERHGATPDDMAAWVWRGPDDHGLAAYLNTNELDPPPRFYYSIGRGNNCDYLSPLMACSFLEEDIVNFQPDEMYMTGRALLDRWSKRPGIHAEAFIRAKIGESRLLSMHPIYGGTQGTFAEDSIYPPLECGLFERSRVLKIEAEDFGEDIEGREVSIKPPDETELDTNNWKLVIQREAARRWTALRREGANPTKNSIQDDLARWCRDHDLKSKTGINPSAAYISRHVLKDWDPPID